jgi:hypothetical protein
MSKMVGDGHGIDWCGGNSIRRRGGEKVRQESLLAQAALFAAGVGMANLAGPLAPSPSATYAALNTSLTCMMIETTLN